MRKSSEIVDRIKTTAKQPMNFEPEVLAQYLSFDDAADVRNEKVTQDEWGTQTRPLTRDAVLEDAAEYMGRIGWDKCVNHRGISAYRTIQKMTAWVWLIEDGDAVAFLEDDANYPQYGAPALKYLCERFGWPIPDDESVLRMAAGKPCGADYECGCDK